MQCLLADISLSPKCAVSISRHITFVLPPIMMSFLLLGMFLWYFTCWFNHTPSLLKWNVSTLLIYDHRGFSCLILLFCFRISQRIAGAHILSRDFTYCCFMNNEHADTVRLYHHIFLIACFCYLLLFLLFFLAWFLAFNARYCAAIFFTVSFCLRISHL